MTWLLYHNPACATSRNTLALLRHAGIEPTVIEYLVTPPSKPVLRDLIARANLQVREAMRERGTPFAALGLDDPALTDDARLDAMTAHPILINRPLVVAPHGAKLCRPSDTVLDLLPGRPMADLDKDDGTAFLADERIEPGPALIDALMETHLLVDDLRGPDRTFYRFRRLGGSIVGYGGMELYGRDVLLRSVVVLRPFRAKGLGRAIGLLLMRRAFDRGARQAYALTTTAAAFFEKLGFTPMARAEAPAAILATRLASGLGSASAPLLAQRILL